MFSRSDRLRPNTISNRLNGTKSNKSSVDDFDMELGIVRVRVGLSYDPLRLSPSSGDLWFNHIIMCTCICMCIPLPLTPTTTTPPNKNPLEKATMSVLFSHTSLFCPSDKRRRNWKKGTMREARHGGFFFSVRFQIEVLGPRSATPLAPSALGHAYFIPSSPCTIDRPTNGHASRWCSDG